MPQILLTLSEEENKLVEAYKLSKQIKSKEVAIKTMIGEFTANITINKE
jgi:hypothetical protein